MLHASYVENGSPFRSRVPNDPAAKVGIELAMSLNPIGERYVRRPVAGKPGRSCHRYANTDVICEWEPDMAHSAGQRAKLLEPVCSDDYSCRCTPVSDHCWATPLR